MIQAPTLGKRFDGFQSLLQTQASHAKAPVAFGPLWGQRNALFSISYRFMVVLCFGISKGAVAIQLVETSFVVWVSLQSI